MALSDKLKQITAKAKESAVEHREQISGVMETAGAIADKRTRGRYSDKIAKARSKTEAAVDRLAAKENADDGSPATPPPATPPVSSPPPAAPPSASSPPAADAPPTATPPPADDAPPPA